MSPGNCVNYLTCGNTSEGLNFDIEPASLNLPIFVFLIDCERSICL